MKNKFESDSLDISDKCHDSQKGHTPETVKLWLPPVIGWWIAPVLGSLSDIPLMLGATILTAFNDNAAITYLSKLVPNFTESLKYAVVSGAVTGGGLTIIANAPNPAGLSILKGHFNDELSPLNLLKAALPPTIIALLCFALLGNP